MTNNTYTLEGIRRADGSPALMMPFTVTWEERSGSDLGLTVTAPDGSEWTVSIRVDEFAESPRKFDGNITTLYAWTGGHGGYDVLIDELEGSNTAAAKVLKTWIDEFGVSDMEAIERRFSKWVALTGSDLRIKDWGSNGHSQSDWARGIALFKESDREYVDTELEVYGQYLWGDVYGYEIEETGDSCWGFYGDDWAKNGAMDYIASLIRAEILERREKAEQEARDELERIAEEKAAAEKAAADLVRAKLDAARMVRHLINHKAA